MTPTVTSGISLVDFAQDPDWVGRYVDLWPRQVDQLANLEDPAVRLHIICWARQLGKTTLVAYTAIHNCVCRPDLDKMLPRRRTRFVLVAAPGLDQSREFVNIAKGICEESPIISQMAEFGADRIVFTLPDGRRSCILAVPANAKTVRGKSSSLIVFDEHSQFDLSAGPGSDERMFRALRPSLRRFGSAGRIVSISTPDGEHGTFARLYREADTGVLKTARAYKAAAWEVDPSYDDGQKESDRAELGEDGWLAEVAAEFIEGGKGTFFDLSEVRWAEAPTLPEDGRNWKIGCDVALHSDRFGIACVGESILEPGQLVVGAVAALDPPRTKRASDESLEEQQERERTMLDRAWAVIQPYAATPGALVIADTHKGGPLKSYLGRKGAPVKLVAPGSTIDMQRAVSTRTRLCEDGSLTCWAHPQLLRDLKRIRVNDAGKIQFPRFEGGHTDAGVALLTAVGELQAATGAPQGKPSGGPKGVTLAPAGEFDGVGIDRPRTQRDVLEGARTNKFGRDGRRDPDRPGATFGRRRGGGWPSLD